MYKSLINNDLYINRDVTTFGFRYALFIGRSPKLMIHKITKTYNNVDDLISFIDMGILLMHRMESGDFLMLSQSIQSYIDQCRPECNVHHNLYSIDYDHPTFKEVYELYQIQNLPALLVIAESKVKDVTVGSISKMELINYVKLNGGE